jgi:hypothetical protein
MERLLAYPGAGFEDRLNLSFALGLAYLADGNGERAFERLNEGNRLKRSTFTYDAVAEERRSADIQAIFSAKTLARYAGSVECSSSPIFIFGMPRSGTTLVEQILASHRSVFGGGEPVFLSNVVDELLLDPTLSLSAERLTSLGRRYQQLVESKAAPHLRFVDKMPWNYLYAGLISLILPNARMIHCRRDPLDTCLSCYSTQFANGQLFTYSQPELGRYFRHYRELASHWRSVLSPEKYIEVEYETLIDSTESESRRMLEFCDLPWDDACLRFYESKRRVTSASLDQVRSPIYKSSVGRAQAFRPWLSPLEAALSGQRRHHLPA